eukprot:4578718-Pleurochrysis_carterae.AAC.3
MAARQVVQDRVRRALAAEEEHAQKAAVNLAGAEKVRRGSSPFRSCISVAPGMTRCAPSMCMRVSGAC